MTSNFDFLEQDFFHAAESAAKAELQIRIDPRAACLQARVSLENLIKRVFKVDKTLTAPKIQQLDHYVNDPAFLELIPEAVWQKVEYVRKAGNVAAHGKKAPTTDNAVGVVEELFHISYWVGRTYLRKGAEELRGRVFDSSLLGHVSGEQSSSDIEILEAARKKTEDAERALAERDSEIALLRAQIEKIKAENQGSAGSP